MDYEICSKKQDIPFCSNSFLAFCKDITPSEFGSYAQSNISDFSSNEMKVFNENESFLESDLELKENSIDNDDIVFFNEINNADEKSESNMDTFNSNSNFFMTQLVHINEKDERCQLWQFLLGILFNNIKKNNLNNFFYLKKHSRDA